MSSLAYLRHVGPTSLQYRIPFDVGNGDNPKACGYIPCPSIYYALNFTWGKHWSKGGKSGMAGVAFAIPLFSWKGNAIPHF